MPKQKLQTYLSADIYMALQEYAEGTGLSISAAASQLLTDRLSAGQMNETPLTMLFERLDSLEARVASLEGGSTPQLVYKSAQRSDSDEEATPTRKQMPFERGSSKRRKRR